MWNIKVSLANGTCGSSSEKKRGACKWKALSEGLNFIARKVARQIFKVIQSGPRRTRCQSIQNYVSVTCCRRTRKGFRVENPSSADEREIRDWRRYSQHSTHLNLISTRKRFQLGLQINNGEEIIEERAAVLPSNLFINVEDVSTCSSYPRAAGNFIIEQETLLSCLERTENGANHINK